MTGKPRCWSSQETLGGKRAIPEADVLAAPSVHAILAMADRLAVPWRPHSRLSARRMSASDLQRPSRLAISRCRLTVVAWLRKVTADVSEPLFDFLDPLRAEVFDSQEFRFGVARKVIDGADAYPPEAVVRAHAQVELLDQDRTSRRPPGPFGKAIPVGYGGPVPGA